MTATLLKHVAVKINTSNLHLLLRMNTNNTTQNSKMHAFVTVVRRHSRAASVQKEITTYHIHRYAASHVQILMSETQHSLRAGGLRHRIADSLEIWNITGSIVTARVSQSKSWKKVCLHHCYVVILSSVHARFGLVCYAVSLLCIKKRIISQGSVATCLTCSEISN